MIYAQLDRHYTLQRATASVRDAAPAAASLAPSRQPVRASLVEVTTTGAGTVVVSGTSDGASALETLSAAAADVLTTAAEWTALTAFLCSPATGFTVSARALGRDGAPQARRTAIATGIPGKLDEGRPSWRGERPGASEEESATLTLAYADGWEPREGDHLVDESTSVVYGVQGAVAQPDPLRPRWWVVRGTRPR